VGWGRWQGGVRMRCRSSRHLPASATTLGDWARCRARSTCETGPTANAQGNGVIFRPIHHNVALLTVTVAIDLLSSECTVCHWYNGNGVAHSSCLACYSCSKRPTAQLGRRFSRSGHGLLPTTGRQTDIDKSNTASDGRLGVGTNDSYRPFMV
jgi:hypothetical protein